jgi:hypothetical protein
MIDIKAVYSSDAFSLVKGPSSAIARNTSIAEYGQQPMAFHHIVAMNLCALARLPPSSPVAHAPASSHSCHLLFPPGGRMRQALKLPPALADATKTLNVPIPRQVPD